MRDAGADAVKRPAVDGPGIREGGHPSFAAALFAALGGEPCSASFDPAFRFENLVTAAIDEVFVGPRAIPTFIADAATLFKPRCTFDVSAVENLADETVLMDVAIDGRERSDGAHMRFDFTLVAAAADGSLVWGAACPDRPRALETLHSRGLPRRR